MKILVDADACPVKEEIYRVARRTQVPVTVVANNWFRVPREPLIEQVVVSALYAAQARQQPVDQALLLSNIQGTAPLSVVMAEDLATLRAWADGRTVNAG